MNRNVKPMKRILAALLALALLAACAPAALAEAFSAVVTEDSMDVYRDKEMTELLGSLKKYSVVQVSGHSGGIASITFHGVAGYAASADMQAVSEYGKRAVLAAASKIYASPNRASESVTAAKGTRVYVLAVENGWALAEMNGNVGYVEADRLAEADEHWDVIEDADEDDDITYQVAAMNAAASGTTAVTTARTKVYASASTASQKLGTMKKGTYVTLLASNRTWAYVELDGKRGYCQVKYLQNAVAPTPTPETKTIGTVQVKKLRVYKSANTGSKKLGTLKKGEVVTLVRESGSWAYIELNGRYGYCNLAGLKLSNSTVTPSPAPDPSPSPAPSPEPDLSSAIKATVKDSSVAVFKAAEAGSAILGTLPQGTVVNLLAAEGEWAYIELNGKYGYCKLAALSWKDDDDSSTEGYKKESFSATVVLSGAKAYAKPNTASQSVPLTLGASVDVVAYTSDWACITRDGKNAFVPVKHLSRASYAPVTGSGSALQTLLKGLLTYGYYDGAPTTNAAAQEAIKRFQAACGLTQDGVADQTLQRILYSGYAPVSDMLTTPLNVGSKVANVKRLQIRLYALGYLSKTSSVDGEYGAKTASAVSLFQSASALPQTGSADVETLKALYTVSAATLPAGVSAADAGSSAPAPKTSSTYMTEMPSGTASSVTSYSSGMSNAKKLEYAIYVASTKLKCPYVYGATGPNKFDCSGLTQYSFKQIGVSLLRTAYQQGYNNKYAKVEGVGNLRRGDLVFFNTVSDSDLCDHVGIYLGNYYFIHASSGGSKVVCSQLYSGYYNRVFSWGRRILN